MSVSCPNRRWRASTLVVYAIFSRSGSRTKYMRAPAVRDRNKSDAFSSSFHCPKVAYSSNWFTHPSKSPFPSYFSGLRLNFFSSILHCSSLSPPWCSASHPKGDVALKSNRRVASSTAVSTLTPFPSHFSLKSISESASMLVAIIVPLSVDLTPLPPV